MQVVGNCPQCGAPIWSEGQGFFSNRAPAITYSCGCRKVRTPVPKCKTDDPYDRDTVSEALDAMFARHGTVSELGGCIREGCDIRKACDEVVGEYSKAYQPGYGLCVDVLQMIAGDTGYASKVAATALECRERIEQANEIDG